MHNTDPTVMAAVIDERPLQLVKGHLHDEAPIDPGESYEHTSMSCLGLPPLHLISSLRHPHLRTVQLILDKCPASALITDHRGFMPLHYCAYNTRSEEVCELLLNANPNAAFESTKRGKLPFQLAACNKYTVIMDMILDVNPAAIDTLDYNGNTPLHDAAKALNTEAVKTLLRLKPGLNRTRNFHEALPIHKAFYFIEKGHTRLINRQLDTVKAILQVNPEVAALPDENNMLPLHLAVYNRSSLAIIEYVFNIYPSAALVRDRWDKLAVQYADDAEVKKLLMKTAKPLARAGITDSFSRFTTPTA